MTLAPTLIGLSLAIYALAALVSMFRLKTLRDRGALPPALAEYFGPITGRHAFRFTIKGPGLRQHRAQHERMYQGRMFKLLVGREHVEIGDPWLTRLVWSQRVALAGAATLALARFGAARLVG